MPDRIVEPNMSLASPRPHSWSLNGGVKVGADGHTLTVTYVRGGDSDFHHAETAITADAIVVTVYLGRAPWLTERIEGGDSGPFVISAVGIIDTIRLVLDETVGERAIIDGGAGKRSVPLPVGCDHGLAMARHEGKHGRLGPADLRAALKSDVRGTLLGVALVVWFVGGWTALVMAGMPAEYGHEFLPLLLVALLWLLTGFWLIRSLWRFVANREPRR